MATVADKSQTTRDPVRRWTLIVLGLIVVLFLYSIIAARMTPYTSQATVQAFVVRMAPEVAGRVLEVPVIDNQRVKAGETLFRIDPQPYEIAVKQAEARLANVGQTIGASTAAVTSAQERLIEAEAKRDNVREQANRSFSWSKRESMPKPGRTRPTRKSRSPKPACARRRPRSSGRARNSVRKATTTRNSARHSLPSSRPSSISCTPRFRPPRRRHHQSPTHRRGVRCRRPGGADLHRHQRRLDQRQLSREQPGEHQGGRSGGACARHASRAHF